MEQEAPTISGDVTVGELSDRITRRDPEVSRHQGLLVVDPKGMLVGIITRGDLLRALDRGPDGSATVLEAGTSEVIVTFPDERLAEASAKMLRNNIGRLPVVDRNDPRKILGYLGRPGIMAAHLRRLDEEHVREPGWIRQWPINRG